MSHNRYYHSQFVLSAMSFSQCPPDQGSEVAFVGRSNSGKSSALNVITGISKLARVSKTPGRTQAINFFNVDDEHRLVDLPGYGYAKISLEQRQRWQRIVTRYLQGRRSLQALILLMDIRHPLKPLDLQIMEWSEARGIKVHILLTKADKLKRGAMMNTLKLVQKQLPEFCSIQLFSSVTRLGVEEARTKLDELLSQEIS